MNVQKRNGVSIYCLSNGPSLPEWLGERARRNLSKNDEAIRRRIELIQDFQMPSSSSKLVQSNDGRYIMAAGTYPPRIRCFDLHELTMKFERYVNSEVMDMVMLGDDYGKLAMLHEDRTVSFHANYGAHDSIRIPTFGRAMSYEPTSCELLIASKGSRIFRINLEEGRFSEPWNYSKNDANSNQNDDGVSSSCIAVNPAYPAACVGCDDGLVRFWDNRTPDTLRPMLSLDVKRATKGYGYAVAENNGLSAFHQRNLNEISAVQYDSSGMFMAAGTAGGLVALYDVRSSKPLHIQEHKHGMPINTVRFHASSGMILSSDDKLVKVWRYKSSSSSGGELPSVNNKNASKSDGDSGAIGSVRVNVETSGRIANFIIAGDEADPRGEKSGVILCATADQPKMESFYIPAMGVAPRWCSFLENITEELEERDLSRGDSATTTQKDGEEAVYENYKFVSRDDLEQLGVSHLVGTPLLRGYMHGFFMDTNLYNRVKAVANPFEYEEYRKKKIKERLEAKRASRISAKSNDNSRPAVNPELAERMQSKAGTSTTKSAKAAGKVLSDERFGNLFTNPDYQIDEEDENFKLRNPSGVSANKAKQNNLDSDDEDEDEVDLDIDEDNASVDDAEDNIDEDEQVIGGSEDEDSHEIANSSDSDEEEDGFRGAKIRGEAYEEMKAMKKASATQKRKRIAVDKRSSKHQTSKRTLVMKEADDLDAAVKGKQRGEQEEQQSKVIEQHLPLAKRLALKEQQQEQLNTASTGLGDVRLKGGSKEISYVPLDTRKKQQAKEASSGEVRGKRERRGMKDLKRQGYRG
mmetsp:Transcript_39004/g.80982  ORF Transcript_39004/g.80982 Transcript_39004/m.80982 type:complete len:807 (-) Transcript_39004:104-2524(-)